MEVIFLLQIHITGLALWVGAAILVITRIYNVNVMRMFILFGKQSDDVNLMSCRDCVRVLLMITYDIDCEFKKKKKTNILNWCFFGYSDFTKSVKRCKITDVTLNYVHAFPVYQLCCVVDFFL